MKTIVNPVSFFFKKLKIQQKLLISFLTLIVIPLSILTMVIYNKSSEMVLLNMQRISEISLEQAQSEFNYKLERMSTTADSFIFDRRIQSFLKDDLESGSDYQQLLDANIMEESIGELQNDEEIYKIRLFVNDNKYYSHQNITFFSLKDLDANKEIGILENMVKFTFWKYPYSIKYYNQNEPIQVISIARLIKNIDRGSDNFGKLLGAVYIDAKKSIMDELLKKYINQLGGYLIVMDKNGAVIATSNSEISTDEMKDILDTRDKKGINAGRREGNIGKNYSLINFKPLNYGDWQIIYIIPVTSMMQPGIDLRNFSFIVMILLILAAYGLAVYVSINITHRITDLLKKMKRIEKGELDNKVEVDGSDEIGELQNNYNHMLNNITKLMTDNYKMGLDVKHAELKALQAQINPHFLYNTLELINWKAGNNEIEVVDELITQLAKFYKLGLSQGSDFVSIETELDHVKTYVQIQNRRFNNSISLQLDVQQEILKYTIPKLILQPLVENAIIHGIREKENCSGTITIEGRLKDTEIRLLVKDDGVGMTEEQLAVVLNMNSQKAVGSFGVRNVIERIHLFHGKEYGLSFESIQHKGTTISIKLPMT